jgi:uncharacterized protein YneF (UPF0154 family)
VYFGSFNKYIVGTLVLKAGSKQSQIKFQGALDDPAGIVLVNETKPPGWVTNRDGVDFPSWFNGLESPWSYIKWLVIGFAIVAVIFIGLMIGYYVYTWYGSKKGYELLSQGD